ncbi:ATPase [Roseovarius spongiae]|uniref:ATPase n=1 Tax=Roseovarius spongiae TaxID=2320272 RepID=A0A3A8B7K8_9RHOB|nr:ATP12 family protein [Roseovarius spongiae]RKF12869.1 ATPase [Roseovarius spongiae]
MSEWKSRRFWTRAEVARAKGGHTIELDGRPVRTPLKSALIVPTRAMAEAIAAEWDAQEEVIAPLSMPVTRSANSAIDKVAPQRAAVADMLADYGDADLLCYRAAAPAELVAQQAAAWDPLLDWADSELGARLGPRTGVMHEPQDPAALRKLRAEVHALDDFALTALHDLVSLSGSLVIGIAAMRDAQDIKTLWEISRLDENWQISIWGEDEEAAQAAAHKAEAFLHAKRFFDLGRVAT